MQKIKCPYCGHAQNIRRTPEAECRGIFLRCRARHCRKVFEIKIRKDK